MAHHDVTGHASPDDEYLETPPGSSYEHTDATVSPILKSLFWLVVAATLIHVGLGGMYELLIRQGVQQEDAERRYPLAATEEQRLPAAPQLQQFPSSELYQFRLDEERHLSSYGWENKAAGTVRIPIGEAMRLTVERGLPVRAADASQPATTPGMMPADSSSGRTSERRRQ